MHLSKSITTAGASIRNWTARAALLIACIGTVATSQSHTTTTSPFAGPRFTMSAEQQKVTRNVTIRLTPQKDLSASVSVNTNVRIEWTPEEEGSPIPRFRLNWVDSLHGESDAPAEDAQPRPVNHEAQGSFLVNCKARQECLLETRLEFILDSEAPGTVEIADWDLTVAVYHDSPEELSQRDIGITIADL